MLGLASRPSSVTIASSSPAGAIVSSEARPNLFESISPIVRAALALATLITSASARREVVSPASSVTPAAEHERELEVEPGQEVGRPAPGQQPHVLVSSPGVTITRIRSSTTS